jgi:hypothetical protein
MIWLIFKVIVIAFWVIKYFVLPLAVLGLVIWFVRRVWKWLSR